MQTETTSKHPSRLDFGRLGRCVGLVRLEYARPDDRAACASDRSWRIRSVHPVPTAPNSNPSRADRLPVRLSRASAGVGDETEHRSNSQEGKFANAGLRASVSIPVDLEFTDAVHQLNRSSVNILKIATNKNYDIKWRSDAVMFYLLEL
jgi:hypothetical protein